jgi:hypothetical protein
MVRVRIAVMVFKVSSLNLLMEIVLNYLESKAMELMHLLENSLCCKILKKYVFVQVESQPPVLGKSNSKITPRRSQSKLSQEVRGNLSTWILTNA